MTSDPTEEAIVNFVSFTSTSREKAIAFLKANNLDSNKAINAYFEDPTGPQPEANPFQNHPNFQIEHPDPVPDHTLTAPSRPPSTLNVKDQDETPESQQATPTPTRTATAEPDKGLTLAEREERELQQAVAMSLSQNLGNQETGVTSAANQAKFGKATRDHYEEDAWAMTLFDSSAREIIISPDPGARKRDDAEPAFIRPSQDNAYLGGLLTILHTIPLAREALLLRNYTLPNYGYDSQWWNGQPINLPKIVTIQDANEGDTDWDDIIHETQRLVAFLEGSARAFGSADSLASLKGMPAYDSAASIGRFLEAWQAAAVRADPGNQLATVFSSTAYKRSLTDYDSTVNTEFFTLESFVEPDHGQTLYDTLDRTIWPDQVGEELDDVWLEHIAEIFTIRLDASEGAKSVDVKIPATFYPDRYLASCREISREFRAEKLKIQKDVDRIENLASRFSVSKSAAHKGLKCQEVLQKTAAAVLALPKRHPGDGDELTPVSEQETTEAQRLVTELRQICTKLEDKLQELERQKQSVIEVLRNYSKTLTEPSTSPDEPPHHKYTLRGVCTQSHITYILRRSTTNIPDSGSPDPEWQWWRISFSTEDAKARQSKSSQGESAGPKNADVIGYTATKVREVEVLRAAREESKSVLLVYAKDSALNIPEHPAPPQLQDLVIADNAAFQAELQDFQKDNKEHTRESLMDIDEPPPEVPHNTSMVNLAQKVNVFDYQVSSFDEEMTPAQEMEEKGGKPLLSRSNTTNPTTESDWNVVDDAKPTT
ncbi:hypothetical protein FE257_008908 [Aspergillus nanangensis]|uniref:Ubiquitin interaction motif protein n=1 Tax=Aspergillus nanangensis TaxID=2582783 RepID=A0AAD4GYF6_ASPNN|nr:hypothetical protein FE257_008908 [Aspergillus nanangensis]